MSAQERAAAEMGLSSEEYRLVLSILGREPSLTELGIFSVMWSEHCSYKSSKKLLSRLPTSGDDVLQGPGENAGVVALDDEWAVAFKIESHNHPSAVEPYQGAATGVGGILRDIFTMGARPIALLNSLHFGSPEGEAAEPVRRLVRGVVSGIADYGNCVGVPTVGGETHFDPSYRANPLVNVLAAGIVRRNKIALARASTPGDRVLYYGGPTGRDGIHGATFSSATFEAEGEDSRPCVQVGDPFMEKKIMEATLELIEAGVVEAIQDMGAAGLTCSTVEMASRGGTGIRIDLDRVPRRAAGLSPYEIMLSESQERMLAVVRSEKWAAAQRILEKWDLAAVDIGEVTADGMLIVESSPAGAGESRIYAEIVADKLSSEAPLYDLPAGELPETGDLDESEIPDLEDGNHVLRDMLASPGFSSRAWIWEQFDHMVGTATAIRTLGGDAAVVRVDGSSRAIALTLDSAARAARIDPRIAGMLAVAEAARNVACVGATPKAVTNNLNFGNPRNPAIFRQMQDSVDGIAEACRAFGTPVTGGNVSLYNETEGTAISPTHVIGMLGILESADDAVGIAAKGDKIILVGSGRPDLATSGYLSRVHGRVAGVPEPPDFEEEKALHRFLIAGIRQRLILAAHDVSDGGVAVALAEMAIAGRSGMNVTVPFFRRRDVTLFGEGPGRVLVSVSRDAVNDVLDLAASECLQTRLLGRIEGERLHIHPWIDVSVEELSVAHGRSFEEMMR